MRDIVLDLPVEALFLEDCVRKVVEMQACQASDRIA